MRATIILITALFSILFAGAQETMHPAGKYTEVFYIFNGTVHIGNGQVINNGIIKVSGTKIEAVGTDIVIPPGVPAIDARGQQVYPGLILSNTDLGLKEIANGARGSNDYAEVGDLNPSMRSILAYNTDSKIINTLRSNGILLANVAPQGGLISGSSSVVQLDAWNWEDAAYKMDNAIHFNMPSLMARPRRPVSKGRIETPETDVIKDGLDKIETVKNMFREAKAYLTVNNHEHTNIKFEALKGLFNHRQKLYVHCNLVREMLVAIDIAKEFSFDVVIVGGSESYLVAPLLKQNNIAVILNQMHQLPAAMDDDIDQPFKTPAVLQKAGVLFAINDEFEESRYRNLPFNAGTAAAYGLSKEEALSAITLNAARIAGIDQTTGTIEAGKDANIIISEGDILDMRTCIITIAFIQARKIDLNNKQKILYEKYRTKYGAK